MGSLNKIYTITDRGHPNYGEKCYRLGYESSAPRADSHVKLLRGGEGALVQNRSLRKVDGAYIMSMQETGVGVWNFDEQRFIEFVACPAEKRVRIDVYDALDNYAVFAGTWAGRTFTISSDRPLSDWVIDLT